MLCIHLSSEEAILYKRQHLRVGLVPSSVICVRRATMIGSRSTEFILMLLFFIAVAGTSARPRTFKKVIYFSLYQLLS